MNLPLHRGKALFEELLFTKAITFYLAFDIMDQSYIGTI